MGAIANIKTALGYSPRPAYLASPFSDGALSQLVWSDILGTEFKAPLNRAEAMAIPAVSKARNLICATVAKLPLRAANSSGLLAYDAQPAWTYRTDGDLSPFMRMLWTVDDLLMYDQSLWQVVRGSEGQILTADRVPFEWWTVTPEGAITINGEPVDANDVVYIPGPMGAGLLDRGQRTLHEARAIESAVATRAKSPIPVMELHQVTDDYITETEQRDLVAAYNRARRDPEGATVFTPNSVNLIPHGANADSGFMTEGRNGIRLNVGNLTGVPVALLDGSTSTASLTYSTQEGRRNEFLDYSLDIWLETISGRLSADDVVPRGQHIVFDQTDFLTTLPSPTGPAEQD